MKPSQKLKEQKIKLVNYIRNLIQSDNSGYPMIMTNASLLINRINVVLEPYINGKYEKEKQGYYSIAVKRIEESSQLMKNSNYVKYSDSQLIADLECLAMMIELDS